jgi:hypothetical protein
MEVLKIRFIVRFLRVTSQSSTLSQVEGVALKLSTHQFIFAEAMHKTPTEAISRRENLMRQDETLLMQLLT